MSQMVRWHHHISETTRFDQHIFLFFTFGLTCFLCVGSETPERRPLIQSYWKNSWERRKNQIHHRKCHKDSHCARRHVSYV